MKWIISNHKMNLTLPEIAQYISKIDNLKTENRLVFCPSFPFLPYFQSHSQYKIGAQNVASEHNGAWTGEVSVEQLKSLAVEYIIIGHSERRNRLGESLTIIHDKMKIALENEMIPILCIGEKEDEQAIKHQILEQELETALQDQSHLEKVIVAYEPIWAIGTGKIPTNFEIRETIQWIKNYLEQKYHCNCPVLYGGSVSPENIEELNKIDNVDGYLIGGTSLQVEKLQYIIEKTEE